MSKEVSLLQFIAMEEEMTTMREENHRLQCGVVLERIIAEVSQIAIVEEEVAVMSHTNNDSNDVAATVAATLEILTQQVVSNDDLLRANIEAAKLAVQSILDSIVTTIQINKTFEELQNQQRQHEEVIEMKDAVIEEFTTAIIQQQEAEKVRESKEEGNLNVQFIVEGLVDRVEDRVRLEELEELVRAEKEEKEVILELELEAKLAEHKAEALLSAAEVKFVVEQLITTLEDRFKLEEVEKQLTTALEIEQKKLRNANTTTKQLEQQLKDGIKREEEQQCVTESIFHTSTMLKKRTYMLNEKKKELENALKTEQKKLGDEQQKLKKLDDMLMWKEVILSMKDMLSEVERKHEAIKEQQTAAELSVLKARVKGELEMMLNLEAEKGEVESSVREEMEKELELRVQQKEAEKIAMQEKLRIEKEEAEKALLLEKEEVSERRKRRIEDAQARLELKPTPFLAFVV